MSKIQSLFLSLFLLLPLFVVSSAFGDTVTLKTGEHLEGKISAETDKDVTMQVQVSAGITDERVIPKSQIEKLDKVTPEVEAYRQIAAIQLGKDSMAVAQYDPYIRALTAFVEEYPKSTRTIDVQKVLDSFEQEKKRVEAGEIKMSGQWLSKAQVAKEKVQIGGELAFSYMKGQSAQGDMVGALNTFAAIEKNFPGAVVMPDAIDLAQKDLLQLEGEVKRAIPDQKAIVDQHKKDLAAAGPTDRAVMSGAIKRQEVAEDASIQASGNSAWPPFYKDSEKSLSALVTKMNTEGPRLAALPVEKMRQSLQLTSEGKQALSGGDTAGGLAKLKAATDLWAANEFAQRLTKEATEDQKATAAAPVPTAAAATPAPATPKMKRSAPMPQAAAATGTAAASAPASAASAAPAVATTTATTTATATTQNESSDDDSFITMPRIIMAVALIALLVIGASIMKKKKRAAEEA
ncbi:MAG TPA: PTPDL family protein [Chthoniobacter sp.]|jgi:hypothetical protein